MAREILPGVVQLDDADIMHRALGGRSPLDPAAEPGEHSPVHGEGLHRIRWRPSP